MYDLVVLERRSAYRIEFRRKDEKKPVCACPVYSRDGQVVPDLSRVTWDERGLSPGHQNILGEILRDRIFLEATVIQAIEQGEFPKIVPLSPRRFNSYTKAKPRPCGRMMDEPPVTVYNNRGGSRF